MELVRDDGPDHVHLTTVVWIGDLTSKTKSYDRRPHASQDSLAQLMV